MRDALTTEAVLAVTQMVTGILVIGYIHVN